MSKKVIISVSSDIVTDQRVLKMAGVINEADCDVIILGRILPDSLPVDDLPFRIMRFRMIFKKGFLFYKWLNIRILFYLLFHRADILVANDLDTLLPNYIISRFKRIELIFDSHEYFTGVPELADRKFVRCVWKYLERKTVPALDHVITVNELIADLYRKEYNIEPVVVRNLSQMPVVDPVNRNLFCSDNDSLLLVHQGTWNNESRGLDELLEAVRITNGIHLMVIGKGASLDALKSKIKIDEYSNRVTFLPHMKWEEMMSYTKAADIGFSLEKGDSLSYRFSLPNKVFEYISAGVALITSGQPEVKKIIDEFNCGISIDSNNPGLISEALVLLRDNRNLLKRLKDNSRKAAAMLNWDTEKEKVRSIYREAGLPV